MQFEITQPGAAPADGQTGREVPVTLDSTQIGSVTIDRVDATEDGVTVTFTVDPGSDLAGLIAAGRLQYATLGHGTVARHVRGDAATGTQVDEMLRLDFPMRAGRRT